MMTATHRRFLALSSAALALACALAAPAPALAQVSKPFKVTGSGVGPNGLPLPPVPPQLPESRKHWAIGQATHLGRYYGEGTVQTISAAPTSPTTIEGTFGSGDRPFVFTAANGDQLVTWYGRQDKGADHDGTFTLDILGLAPTGLIVKAHWVAEFVVDPVASTGKLHGVTGSWVMDAYSEPFVLGSSDPVGYSWSGQGTLDFPKGK